MAACYDKHFEVKNKWQNQRIAKYHKNHCTSGYRWVDVDFLKKQHDAKKQIDLEDYQLCVDYNNIPVWDCARCTYTNIERKALCQMCGVSYGSMSYKQSTVYDAANSSDTLSNHMTLGEFCKNVWDSLSIPVWICSQCTYCNVEQLSRCQMCSHLYHRRTDSYIEHNAQAVQTEEIYGENYEAFDAEDDYKQDEVNMDHTQSICRSDQPQNEVETISKKIKVSVTIKLTPNKLYQKEKSKRLELNNEDILRHTLLEARLDIHNVKKQVIKTYDCIPAIRNKDGSYTAYQDNIIVPIKYKYRNRFGEFGYYPNNDPLKSIAQFVWEAQYPFLDKIDCPRWEFLYPQDKNVRSPAQKQYILDALLAFLPLRDVVTAILFRYLGYDEMDIVKMESTFEPETAYFARYKNKDFEKDLFMGRNNEKLPFTVYSTAFTMVKSRKLRDRFTKLTEVGYNYSDETYASNNYWSRNKGTVHWRTAAVWSKYCDILYRKYGRKEPRNRHDRKRKRGRKSRRYMENIKQFPPKKYLYLLNCNHSIGGPKPTRRKRQKQRKNAKYLSRYGTSYYYSYLSKWRKEHNPRYCNAFVKWYLQKDKRYTDRKWSAYWKLNERHA